MNIVLEGVDKSKSDHNTSLLSANRDQIKDNDKDRDRFQDSRKIYFKELMAE